METRPATPGLLLSPGGARRRAALAPLDANVIGVPSSPRTAMAAAGSIKDASGPAGGAGGFEGNIYNDNDDDDGVENSRVGSGTKRLAAGAQQDDNNDDELDAASPATKKARLAGDQNHARPQRSRSQSPDASSVFDASWATVATNTTVPDEPEVLNRLPPAPVPAVASSAPRMTREQARQKVEILRLRLGLANYKLRTGQTAVPLADLQHRPLPPRRTVRVQSPPSLPRDASSSSSSSSSSLASDSSSGPFPSQESITQSWRRQDDTRPSPGATSIRTPERRDEDDAGAGGERVEEGGSGSAYMRGGAASGLLSLAMGQSLR